MRPKINLLYAPSLSKQGFSTVDFPYLRSQEFQQEALRVYKEATPARNAENSLPRLLRWGVFVHDRFEWLDRATYSLPAELNPQEKGNLRLMDLFPEDFLRRPEMEKLFREVFEMFGFTQSSSARAFEVQLSGICFNPTHGGSAVPPPPYPHRDAVDGAVVVLNKKNVLGGINRIFANDGSPLYEFELDEGQGFVIVDKAALHYVTDVQLPLGVDEGYRHIIIVRFQPLGR
jgi:hypothetical protein